MEEQQEHRPWAGSMLDKLVDWPSEHKGEWPGWEQNLEGMAVDNQKRLSVYRTIKLPYLRLSFCG